MNDDALGSAGSSFGEFTGEAAAQHQLQRDDNEFPLHPMARGGHPLSSNASSQSSSVSSRALLPPPQAPPPLTHNNSGGGLPMFVARPIHQHHGSTVTFLQPNEHQALSGSAILSPTSQHSSRPFPTASGAVASDMHSQFSGGTLRSLVAVTMNHEEVRGSLYDYTTEGDGLPTLPVATPAPSTKRKIILVTAEASGNSRRSSAAFSPNSSMILSPSRRGTSLSSLPPVASSAAGGGLGASMTSMPAPGGPNAAQPRSTQYFADQQAPSSSNGTSGGGGGGGGGGSNSGPATGRDGGGFGSAPPPLRQQVVAYLELPEFVDDSSVDLHSQHGVPLLVGAAGSTMATPDSANLGAASVVGQQPVPPSRRHASAGAAHNTTTLPGALQSTESSTTNLEDEVGLPVALPPAHLRLAVENLQIKGGGMLSPSGSLSSMRRLSHIQQLALAGGSQQSNRAGAEGAASDGAAIAAHYATRRGPPSRKASAVAAGVVAAAAAAATAMGSSIRSSVMAASGHTEPDEHLSAMLAYVDGAASTGSSFDKPNTDALLLSKRGSNLSVLVRALQRDPRVQPANLMDLPTELLRYTIDHYLPVRAHFGIRLISQRWNAIVTSNCTLWHRRLPSLLISEGVRTNLDGCRLHTLIEALYQEAVRAERRSNIFGEDHVAVPVRQGPPPAQNTPITSPPRGGSALSSPHQPGLLSAGVSPRQPPLTMEMLHRPREHEPLDVLALRAEQGLHDPPLPGRHRAPRRTNRNAVAHDADEVAAQATVGESADGTEDVIEQNDEEEEEEEEDQDELAHLRVERFFPRNEHQAARLRVTYCFSGCCYRAWRQDKEERLALISNDRVLTALVSAASSVCKALFFPSASSSVCTGAATCVSLISLVIFVAIMRVDAPLYFIFIPVWVFFVLLYPTLYAFFTSSHHLTALSAFFLIFCFNLAALIAYFLSERERSEGDVSTAAASVALSPVMLALVGCVAITVKRAKDWFHERGLHEAARPPSNQPARPVVASSADESQVGTRTTTTATSGGAGGDKRRHIVSIRAAAIALGNVALMTLMLAVVVAFAVEFDTYRSNERDRNAAAASAKSPPGAPVPVATPTPLQPHPPALDATTSDGALAAAAHPFAATGALLTVFGLLGATLIAASAHVLAIDEIWEEERSAAIVMFTYVLVLLLIAGAGVLLAAGALVADATLAQGITLTIAVITTIATSYNATFRKEPDREWWLGWSLYIWS